MVVVNSFGGYVYLGGRMREEGQSWWVKNMKKWSTWFVSDPKVFERCTFLIKRLPVDPKIYACTLKKIAPSQKRMHLSVSVLKKIRIICCSIHLIPGLAIWSLKKFFAAKSLRHHSPSPTAIHNILSLIWNDPKNLRLISILWKLFPQFWVKFSSLNKVFFKN